MYTCSTLTAVLVSVLLECYDGRSIDASTIAGDAFAQLVRAGYIVRRSTGHKLSDLGSDALDRLDASAPDVEIIAARVGGRTRFFAPYTGAAICCS